jgi:hypothetical protein
MAVGDGTVTLMHAVVLTVISMGHFKLKNKRGN